MSARFNDIGASAKTIAVALVSIMLIAVILNAFVGVGLSIDFTAEFTPQTGDGVEVASYGDLDDWDVRLTEGYAGDFTGTSERYLQAPVAANWTDGNWSVLLSANLSENASTEAAYQAFAWNDSSVIVQYENQTWLAYANLSNGSATASVPAEPGTWEHPVVTFDNTTDTLTLDVNGTNESAVLDGATEDRMLAADWRGQLDEIRVLETVVGDSDIQQYRSDPVAVLDAEAEHAARVMFNEGEGTETQVYYADRTATLVGVGFVDSPFTGPDLVEGTDYAIDFDPIAITALADGAMDGAPTAFITGESGPTGGIVESLLTTGVAALVLLVVGTLVFAATAVARQLDDFGKR